MHAIYLYLMDSGDAVPAWLFRDWESIFESYCDENNWYQPVHAIINGKTFDYKSDTLTGEVSEEAEKQWTSDDIKLFAIQVAAYDMHMYGWDAKTDMSKVNDMSYDELLAALTCEIPEQLSKMYASKRQRMSAGYEKFINSYVPPFHSHATRPYDWRCCDLRSESSDSIDDGSTDVIILDIHT